MPCKDYEKLYSFAVAIGKLHDCIMYYWTQLFMVLRKIKFNRNVLEIITGMHFQSHNGYILPIQFHMVGART